MTVKMRRKLPLSTPLMYQMTVKRLSLFKNPMTVKRLSLCTLEVVLGIFWQ
nr:hypothetical protein [Nostoc sp. ChiQUE02]